MNPAYTRLIEKTRESALLSSTSALLSWDQEVLMPKKSVEYRAKALKQLAEMVHRMTTDPELADLLQACEEDKALMSDPTSVTAVNVREIRRDHDRSTRLPEELVAELSEVTSLAQHEWAQARAKKDFERFRPWLERMVTLMRRKAEHLGTPEGGEAWDALGDLYETGIRAKDLEPLFAALREELSTLLRDLEENGKAPNASLLEVPSSKEQQKAFVEFVTSRMGFDYDRGRLDVSTHPFCSGTHCNDVRLTTRFHESHSLDALGSTMHEAGHGIYEQGLLSEYTGTPMGSSVSLGVHESQSRMWENMVGRSEAFWDWLSPQLPEFFGDAFAAYGPRDFYGASNIVRPSFIRVEADELTYNLHVMVRFEIELALMRGEVEAADIPDLWNEKYLASLGIEVPDVALGCLQDVHWSAGLFGYFPTYTLGNIYAAQIYATAERQLGDLAPRFSKGKFAPLKTWLNENIHAQGQRYLAPDLIRHVCGEGPDSSYLIHYLSEKLRPIYGLA